jgi:hypothetical protein
VSLRRGWKRENVTAACPYCLRDESRDSRERLFARGKQANKELSRGSPRAWRIKFARKSVATTISVDGSIDQRIRPTRSAESGEFTPDRVTLNARARDTPS